MSQADSESHTTVRVIAPRSDGNIHRIDSMRHQSTASSMSHAETCLTNAYTKYPAIRLHV